MALPVPSEAVDMVSNAVDGDRHAAFAAHGPSEVFDETAHHITIEPRSPILRGKEDVINQVAVGLRHVDAP